MLIRFIKSNLFNFTSTISLKSAEIVIRAVSKANSTFHYRAFRTPVHDMEEFKRRITEATDTVNLNMLLNMWKNLHIRPEFLQQNNGEHYEVFK